MYSVPFVGATALNFALYLSILYLQSKRHEEINHIKQMVNMGVWAWYIYCDKTGNNAHESGK